MGRNRRQCTQAVQSAVRYKTRWLPNRLQWIGVEQDVLVRISMLVCLEPGTLHCFADAVMNRRMPFRATIVAGGATKRRLIYM